MNLPKLSVSLGSCYLVALAGSAVTLPGIMTWYQTLNKPLFTPPNWIFGPVWTLLYTLMAISLYLIWQKRNRFPVVFFWQLLFNFLWSLVFFNFHQITLAFIIIVCLWFLILATIRTFQKISVMAAWLLVPYVIWVSFAAILNLAVAIIN